MNLYVIKLYAFFTYITKNFHIFDKRAGGIEPPSSAWKAEVLPLNYARLYALSIQ
jgi:hypothetical protein